MRLSSRTQFLRFGTDINKINRLVQTTNLGSGVRISSGAPAFRTARTELPVRDTLLSDPSRGLKRR